MISFFQQFDDAAVRVGNGDSSCGYWELTAASTQMIKFTKIRSVLK